MRDRDGVGHCVRRAEPRLDELLRDGPGLRIDAQIGGVSIGRMTYRQILSKIDRGGTALLDT